MQLHFLHDLVLVQLALIQKELEHAGLTAENGSIRCHVVPSMDAALIIDFGG